MTTTTTAASLISPHSCVWARRRCRSACRNGAAPGDLHHLIIFLRLLGWARKPKIKCNFNKYHPKSRITGSPGSRAHRGERESVAHTYDGVCISFRLACCCCTRERTDEVEGARCGRPLLPLALSPIVHPHVRPRSALFGSVPLKKKKPEARRTNRRVAYSSSNTREDAAGAEMGSRPVWGVGPTKNKLTLFYPELLELL